jgi:hypothetical protein
MRGRRLKKPDAYSLNTLRIFTGRERRRGRQIVRRSRMALCGQAPRTPAVRCGIVFFPSATIPYA